jgi:hypothetical protein
MLKWFLREGGIISGHRPPRRDHTQQRGGGLLVSRSRGAAEGAFGANIRIPSALFWWRTHSPGRIAEKPPPVTPRGCPDMGEHVIHQLLL